MYISYLDMRKCYCAHLVNLPGRRRADQAVIGAKGAHKNSNTSLEFRVEFWVLMF